MVQNSQTDWTHPPVEEDRERDYYEMMFGRGTADADLYGYPGENDPDYVPMNKPSYPKDSVIVCSDCNLVERKDDIDLSERPF